MAVGKPDFDLNSYGIQYKEKKVNYTNKRIGMNSQVTTETEQASEHAKWEKMNKPLGVQSNNSKKRGEPAPKPNAAQRIGSAPRPTPEPEPEPKNETQPATSSPPTEGHEDTTGTVERKPHATRKPDIRTGEFVDLHEGKGRKQSQGEGLSTISTQEGGSSHVQMKPSVPKRGGAGGGGDQKDDLIARELRQKHPTNPKGYTPPTKKELTNIRGTDKPSRIKDGKIIEGKTIPEKQKDPKGLRGEKGTEYNSQRLASIKSSAEETLFKAMSLKLDLMKDLNTKNSKTSIPTMPSSEGQEFQEQSTTARMGKIYDDTDYEDTPKTGSSPKGTGGSLQTSDTWQGGQEDSEYRKITNPLYTNDGKGKYDVQSSPSRKRGAPKVDPRNRKKDPIKTIPKTASEIIFKAISLKLDLMKTTGKNTGDTPSYITEVTNPETGKIEQNKEFEKKPTFTDLKGDNPHTNPTHIQGKGFKGRQMRRIDPETKEEIKVPKETTTKKIGNVPRKHKKGDIVPHNSPSLQETPENLRRRMDYLMHGEKIGGDLTNTKTQKELDEEHNSNEADAFAKTEAGKRIAAKIARQNSKKSLNDIIIKMNIMKLDIMKETEVERIKKIPANTDEEIQQKRFALSDAQRSDNMAKPDKSLLLD